MDPLTNREQAKLQAEIARQEKQEKQAGQQKLVREGQLQKQHRRQQEMLRYQQSKSDWLAEVKPAPTFYPTAEQFKDPIAYIRSIQAEGSEHGICKIVPPVLPSIPSGLVLDKPEGSKLTFSTREQLVEQLTWDNFDIARFWDSGKTYTIRDYERFADDFQRRRFGLAGCLPAQLVEADYWRQVSSNDNPVVEYGNDVEGTAFCPPDQQDALGSSSWNLQILPHVEQSTLRLLRGDAPGVSSPMLYIGMLFATFAWHVEDHYLYSINYQHLGAAKTWYGVPGSDADGFEAVVRQHVYSQAVAAARAAGKSEAEVAAAVHTALLGKTTMFTPELLLDAGIHVTRVVQAPGEYVITFPRAYHGGFSNGFCVGEAVNFSIADWFPFGLEAANRYRRLGRLPVLAHDELLCLEGLALHEQMQETKHWQDHPQADLHIVLMTSFVHLIREQHLQRARLLSQGLTHVKHLPFSASMPCCRCKGMIYIAEVVSGDDWTVPLCLACALAQPPASQCPLKIRVQSNIAELEAVAQSFEVLLRQAVPGGSAGSCKRHGLDLTGLTEAANFGLPEGSLNTGSPQDSFDWSAAPNPDFRPKSDATTHQHDNSSAADDQNHDDATANQQDLVGDQQGPSQDLAAYQDPPEELITCQRDAPEPLAKPMPARSGKPRGVRGPVHGVKGPSHRSPASKGTSVKASSSSGQRAQSNSNGDVLPSDGQPSEPELAYSHRNDYSSEHDNQRSAHPPPRTATPSYPPEPVQTVQDPQLSLRINKPSAARPKEQPVVARRQSQRTPRKRAFSSDEEHEADAVEPQKGSHWQAHTHRHGSERQPSRMANSSAADHREALQYTGHAQEEAELGRGHAERARGPGKRPTVKWSKLGSDAESPPGKRSKVQVPGVKAANGAYIPPGPMLNTAATRLACLEDIEVNVSGPGAARRLFRRRIFAPEEDREERYLTASDVVKGSGFETNTSASNIIDRWTREACSIIVRHNQRNNTDLPMPELPARAFCAGMASSCYVLKAVDVEMLMLPGVLKEDLRANLQRYIASVWPRLTIPISNPMPAAQPRSTHQASKPLSRPSSAQPLSQPSSHHSRRKRSAPRSYDEPDRQDDQDSPRDYQAHVRPASAGASWPRQARSARNGPGAVAAARGPSDGPLGHSKGFGGMSAASSQAADDSPASPKLQRVLRSRGGPGRAGKHADQAASLRVANWGSDQLQGHASQGLDVLAGLAESALTEQQRAEESADPLPLDIKIPRPQSAATANQDTARPQPSREPASSHQRQHLGIPTFSQPMTSGQPHLYSKGSGLSQAAPSGVFNTGVPGQFPPTAFRQPNHSSLLPEHLQSAVLQASRQQQSQIQQQTLPQSRPYSAGSLSGRGQTQGPMPPQDHPSAVLWKGGGSDTIIRPQAVRSTGFPIPTYTQPHHASVAALHSKPVGALSPGSPTSVMQRSVQGLQGSAQHPLDPSPASTDSASGATAATAEQQTSLKSVAAPDGIAAAAPTGKDVSKSQHAAAPASQAQAAHPLLPSQATSEGTQANLADSAHQLKAGQARASEGLSGQGGAAPAAATTSAVSAAQDVSHTKPQPHRALEASAPLKSSGPPTSTAPAAQQQQGSRLANNDQLPEAAHQQQGAMQDLEQGMLRHQQQHAVAASSGLLTEVKSSQPPASASGQHSQSVVAGTQQAPGPHTAEPRQHSQGANAGGLSKSQQLSVAGSWPNRLAAMSMPDGASTSGASTSGASTGLGSIPHNNQPGHHLLHAAAAYMPQQGPSWSVQRLSNGQWVCAMDDGATLNLEQLYYTFHSVGRNLPQDKLQALGSMIEQLSRLGEKGPPLPQSAS